MIGHDSAVEHQAVTTNTRFSLPRTQDCIFVDPCLRPLQYNFILFYRSFVDCVPHVNLYCISTIQYRVQGQLDLTVSLKVLLY